MTHAELKAAAMKVLTQAGCKVWSNSAGRFRGYQIGLKGVPDIIGLHLRSGLFVAVDAKTGKDTLSTEQAAFLSSVHRAGGFAFAAWDDTRKMTDALVAWLEAQK